jgi:hypothetical protein
MKHTSRRLRNALVQTDDKLKIYIYLIFAERNETYLKNRNLFGIEILIPVSSTSYDIRRAAVLPIDRDFYNRLLKLRLAANRYQIDSISFSLSVMFTCYFFYQLFDQLWRGSEAEML